MLAWLTKITVPIAIPHYVQPCPLHRIIAFIHSACRRWLETPERYWRALILFRFQHWPVQVENTPYSKFPIMNAKFSLSYLPLTHSLDHYYKRNF